MRRYALRSLGREAAGLCRLCSSSYAAEPNRSERVSRLSAANDEAQRRSLALTQERAKIILRALPGGRTAEASCRLWDRLRSMAQPGEPGEGERTSLGSRTLQHRAIPEERPSDLHWSAATSGGCGGLCPPAAWHTTALDVRHEPASFPCWRSACHSPWEPSSCVRMALQDEQPRAPLRGADSPASGGSPGRLRSRPEEPAGERTRPVPPGANAIGKAPAGRGILLRLAQAVVSWCSHD